MRFSVIVPVYNTAAYLARCVDSVLAQTVADWELILVNNGSSDGSGLLAEAYARKDSRIRVLHKEHEGPLQARRAGLARAVGEYVLFLDSDDAWRPDCLAVLDAAITEHAPDVILFTGQVLSPAGERQRLVGQYAREATWIGKDELYRAILSGHEHNAIWLKLFRRELFDGDDTDYSVLRDTAAGEDKAQALFPLTAADRILFLPAVLYDHIQNPTGIICSARPSRASQYLAVPVFAMVYDYMKRWGMDDAENRERLAVYYLRHFLSVSYGLRRQCRTVQARREFRKFPWKRQLSPAVLSYRSSRLLTAKEKLKLFAALWMLL